MKRFEGLRQTQRTNLVNIPQRTSLLYSEVVFYAQLSRVRYTARCFKHIFYSLVHFKHDERTLILCCAH